MPPSHAAPACRFLGLDPDQGRPHLTNVNTREQHLMAKGELEKGQKVGSRPGSRAGAQPAQP